MTRNDLTIDNVVYTDDNDNVVFTDTAKVMICLKLSAVSHNSVYSQIIHLMRIRFR